MSSINDRNDWKSVKNALQVIDFDETNTRVSHCITDVVYHCCYWLVSQSTQTCASVQHLFEVVASVLHLGNVQFDADGKGHALLNDRTDLDRVSNVRKRLNVFTFSTRVHASLMLFFLTAFRCGCQQASGGPYVQED